MCRWIAYTGQPIYIDQIVTVPTHSLVQQSLNTKLRFSVEGDILNVNGDGFGIGWYGEKDTPGVFKDESPAWSNRNLHNLSAQIKARTFFAHIRASTTGTVQRTNCHPFKYKNWLFQHNGHVSDFPAIKQELFRDVASEFYPNIKGSTDSELFFHLALSYGLQKNPKEALQKMVKRVQEVAKEKGTEGELNLSCALSDGDALYILRYAEGDEANSQFYSSDFNVCRTAELPEKECPEPGEHIVVVSEPLDHLEDHWTAVPDNTFGVIRGVEISLETFL